MSYEILPVLVRGTHCNVSDHVFKQIWDQLVAENRLAMLFFSGEVKSFTEWRQLLTSPSHIAAIAVDAQRGRFCHVAWLNGVAGHRANAHHAALGQFRPGAARAILRYWQGLRNGDGTPAIHLLLGVTPEANPLARRALRVLGFQESGVVPMMDRLGEDCPVALAVSLHAADDELRTSHDLAVATAPIDSPIGPIEPGLVAAQRFTWQGTVDGEPVVTAAVNWFMGEQHLDPGWTFGAEGERFEVEVTGDPGCSATFHGWHPPSIEAGLARNPGIVATAQHCVNSIPVVCAAGPGVRTYLDLPIVTARAAPHLQPGRGGAER